MRNTPDMRRATASGVEEARARVRRARARTEGPRSEGPGPEVQGPGPEVQKANARCFCMFEDERGAKDWRWELRGSAPVS